MCVCFSRIPKKLHRKYIVCAARYRVNLMFVVQFFYAPVHVHVHVHNIYQQ